MNNRNPTIYAETLPYWKTSQTSAEGWINRARKEITSIGGTIQAEAFISDAVQGAAFTLGFRIAEQSYRVTWPVMKSKDGSANAAKVQAATALYHDVKARVVAAKFLGVRNAFLPFLVLPTGQTAGEAAAPELLANLPKMALGSGK